MSARCSIAVLVAVIVLAGCSQATQKTSVTTAPDDKPYQFESEGQAPPPTAGETRREVDHIDVFEETPVTKEPIEVETVAPVALPPEIADSMMVGPGYRVQVFATGTQATADIHLHEAETRLGVPAYVELVDGMYKVRVGDCRSREEAEQLLGHCRGAGYTDAWIVSTDVRWRRPSQSPPGKPKP